VNGETGTPQGPEGPLLARYFRLLSDRRFFPYFSAQFLGAFNDNFFKNALILLVTYRFPEPPGVSRATLVALAGGLFTLPFFLCSAQAGKLADRHDKARMAWWVKIAELAIVLFATAFLFQANGSALVALFLALVALGVHSAFFGPLKYGILPELVPADRVLDANALVGGSTFLAILLGTLAGGLASSASTSAVWTTGLPLVLVALLGVAAARAIPRLGARAPELVVSRNPFAGTFVLLHEGWRARDLRPIYLLVSWFWFLGAGLLSVLAPFCRETFGDEAWIASVFLAAFSVGIAVGAAVSPALVRAVGRERTVRGSAWVMAGGLAVVALLPKVAGPVGMSTHFLGFLLVAAAGGAYAVPLMTELQLRSPHDRRARSIATNNVLNALAMVLASGVLALLYRLGQGFAVALAFFSLTAAAVAVFARLSSTESGATGRA
jgi:MFS family permease